MARLIPFLFGLAMFALWVWAVLDVIATDKTLVRNLDKLVWLLLVILLPTLGAVAWLALGRPANAGFSPGSKSIRSAPGTYKPAPRGIEDSQTWTAAKPSPPDDGFETTAAKERRLAKEAELEKLEKELDDES